jgi:hypothetical protein
VNPQQGQTAKDFYVNQVDASLRATCASCHQSGSNGAPIWMGGTAEQSYGLITTNANGQLPGLLAAPANSQLVLHGAHTGPALTTAQNQLVSQWLAMEVQARGINPAPVLTISDALNQFAACMSYTDFTDRTATGKSAADVARQQTTNDGSCNGCHNKGDGGFWASYGTINGTDESQVMFQSTGILPFIKKWVTGTVDQTGQFKDLVSSDAIINKASLAAQCVGPACHPKFQLDSATTTAIDTFVNNTLTRWHNKACTAAPGPVDAGTD